MKSSENGSQNAALFVPYSGLIHAVHHVGLPSFAKDWAEIRLFWTSLGLECRDFMVTDDYDHGGVGRRLQVFAGSQLLISYHAKTSEFGVDLSTMHVALSMSPPALADARQHPNFERETHWGHGNTSVFLKGPYGLHVELITTDPGFHRDSEQA